MKTNRTARTTRGLSLTATMAFLATLATVSLADPQYKPTGDDGITASPKVRARLAERAARPETASTLGTAMACPKCQDAFVSVRDPNPKGATVLTGADTKLVARHLCEGCTTTISVTGTFKARKQVATHKCTGCGSETLACCGNGPTKGMEKIEVAPVK